MPAYRERIYICPDQNGEAGWIMDFPVWWERDNFFRKYADRRIDTGNPVYVDYALLLAGWEALAWDQRCRTVFTQDPRYMLDYIGEIMGECEARLKAASWVIVESYEWESGLD